MNLGLNVCYSLEYSNASTPEHNHGSHFNEWFIGCNGINDEINETRSFISFFNLITRSTIFTYILSLPTKMYAIHYEYIIIWTLPDILSCSLHRFTDFQPSSFKWLLVMSERGERERAKNQNMKCNVYRSVLFVMKPFSNTFIPTKVVKCKARQQITYASDKSVCKWNQILLH